jgi:hypothetical protein
MTLRDDTENETHRFVVTASAVAPPAATEVATTNLSSKESTIPMGQHRE